MRGPRLLALALVSSLGLAGCGFTPLYGEANMSALSRIAVTTQDNRLGYRVREQLDDALGRDGSQESLWRLQVDLDQSRRSLGRRIDDTTTRYELTVRGAWTLTPVGVGQPVAGVETVTTTYAAADQPYASIAAQQDGEERAAAELARLIRLDIMRALSAQ